MADRRTANRPRIAARCDLEIGPSLSIAPPGWQKTLDPLCDAFSADKGWSQPDQAHSRATMLLKRAVEA